MNGINEHSYKGLLPDLLSEKAKESYKSCIICPRECRIDRSVSTGYCKADGKIKVAAASLHRWEEPCIAGNRGAGAIFFSHCSLGCVFCQNEDISHGGKGTYVSVSRLADIIKRLEDAGAETVDLVTPTHYTYSVLEAVSIASPSVPVVWNSSGYEKRDTVSDICDVIDVYMPDIKYYSSDISYKLSACADYFEKAKYAIDIAIKKLGKPRLNERGIMERGVLLRHLVLPSFRRDSLDILSYLAKTYSKDGLLISIMRQYTPQNRSMPISALSRRVTSFEYDSVVSACASYGFQGFIQDKESATGDYLPDFDLKLLNEEQL